MEKNCSDKDARYFKVVDAETGIMIHDVTWANDETGEYDQFHRDENGKVCVAESGEELARDRKIGKIKFVDIRQEAK